EHAHKAEERARRMGQRAQRTYVRVNEREWQMNPERFNDLVNRATQAAMEGVTGAMEAVEHAVSNLNMSRPIPPVPPVPPMPPQPHTPLGEQPNVEQEREAILRMIAEGRITPEEGDMLLEGLGS
ncbi:MAG: SHOCT-like domain-containing protein, partial [Ktedonobacteraceae bacterium]